ncbi:hypothetical protein ZYGR_0S01660 [Zygosaccharomyces rouxii]|uniref:Nicotinate phosphoribosyltransferase n=2 Tax=Zygosaccharomyces rouxii TaxID=4956 RepID=C5DXM2_ZYGRC|nr:uncharacterized protein ZYRO0F06182g [Zygosaccharomyces rouxii]KAH9199293.1 Quinolinate phosphoribosyl transferase [Zygosaccharomyces rouxii]GAV50032.1 hypothetical protein ZYGR_0S01660 [Zygosaccharomyces rouxii]CAR28533.1 ZYRO0F06182p [Zygosaccharomyces rouxii]
MSSPAIVSLLDTDLYKLTMHAAVFSNFPEANVVYKYTNRSSQFLFNQNAIDWIREQLELMGNLRFTEDEISYLKKAVPYLPQNYLDFLRGFQLRPKDQVIFTSERSSDASDRFSLDLLVKGKWSETILYEIPILSIVSEAYFKFVDDDWDYTGQMKQAKDKADELFQNQISFSEFGTRRRRSSKAQNIVMEGILQSIQESPEERHKLFLGTSNVMFAKKYGVKPVGTVAHEWVMGIAAITDDYVHANKNSMDYWINTFGPENAGLALTDTFGSDNFLESFKPPYSDHYVGVRQDSGDPIEYAEKISKHYHDKLKLPKFSKSICFSDSLNVKKVLNYSDASLKMGLKPTFGIGTNFTNDFRKKSDPATKSEPLNIVIKLLEVNGNHAVKISDNLGKNMGDPAVVERVKKELGYIERSWEGGDEAHRWSN